MCACVCGTLVAVVIHQDDLGDEAGRRAVQDAVDGPEERGPALVVEGDDDAGVGEGRPHTACSYSWARDTHSW